MCQRQFKNAGKRQLNNAGIQRRSDERKLGIALLEEKLNEDSRMEEEKEHLMAYRPQLELAVVTEAKVTPSSLISVDTVFYSVPEYMVGKRVIVKKYHNEIRVYAANEMVAAHKRLFGNGKMQIDIYSNLIYHRPRGIIQALNRGDIQ